MKRPIKILLSLLGFTCLFAGEFFEDFSYRNTLDPKLNERGWTIVSGLSAPPQNAKYIAKYISFTKDPNDDANTILEIKASCRNTKDSMRHSRIESGIRFLEGTYATRIHFNNEMKKTKDGNIQAFYTISSPLTEERPEYSECDFEYLPYDIWNDMGKTRPAIYASTWENYISDHATEDLAQYIKKQKLKGWHLVIIQIMNGEVSYYLDNSQKPIAIHKISDKGSDVYPESLMRIAFSNWISKVNLKQNKRRTSTIKVDWVYHIENKALSLNEVYKRVRLLQKDDIRYLDTME